MSITITTQASAQNGLYISPKVLYSYQNFDADGYIKPNTNYINGSNSALGGSGGKSTFGGGFAFGYNFNPNQQIPVRIEIETLFRGNSKKSFYDPKSNSPRVINYWSNLSLNTQSYFLNGFYDFHNTSSFTPYLGAGLGLSKISVKATLSNQYSTDDGVSFDDINSWSNKDNNSNFAWNIGLGVAYDISDSIALDLGYRYSDFGDIESNLLDDDGIIVTNKIEVTAHEVILALRYNF